MQRAINVLLLVLIAVGIVQLVLKQRSYSKVKVEHAKLANHYGSLDVKDAQKFQVKRIATNDPMHFLWHCYYPGGIKVREQFGFGRSESGGSSTNSQASTLLYRCRFDFTDGVLRAHVLERGGGARVGFSRQPVVRFIEEHWNQLEFDVLANEGELVIPPSQLLPLLTIRIPNELHEEFAGQVGEGMARRYTDVPFFQIVLGTDEAFADDDKVKANGS